MTIYKTGAIFFALSAALFGTACSSDSSGTSSGVSGSLAVADSNVIALTTEQVQVVRDGKVTLAFKYDAACTNKVVYVTGGLYKYSCTIYTEFGYSTDYLTRSYQEPDSLKYSGDCYFYCK